ncbi:GTPase-activating protein CdGAPr isoform 1-T21 [Glossina fuscipes fuscipes]
MTEKVCSFNSILEAVNVDTDVRPELEHNKHFISSISSTNDGSSLAHERDLSQAALNVPPSDEMESSSDYPLDSSGRNFHLMPSDGDAGSANGTVITSATSNAVDYYSTMHSSQLLALSSDSSPLNYNQIPGNSATSALTRTGTAKPIIAQSVAGKACRFPKLEECAHFHYERVQLGPLTVRLVDDKSDLLTNSIASQSIGGDIASSTGTAGMGLTSLRPFSPSSCWFIIKVLPHRSDAFLIKRSFDNVQMLDEMLHRCVYDRKISGLRNLKEVEFKTEEEVEYLVVKYLERFSKIASDSLTCGTILTWFQLDNKGRRLPLADGDTMRSINTPAVGAAYGVRRYQAQASDEISIEVGDMISVIDMPSPAESIWWRGKKSHLQKSHYEVGFFPQSCVATIGDKVPRNFPMPAPLVGQLDVSPTKPVLRKHGKLIAFFRSFILSRPSRRRLKQSGIYRERVFSCDLSEHLLNSGQEIPMVLKCCAEFIEEYGIVDGIYRLSGITSNIQKLRRAFDEERVPDLGNPEMKQDIHAVSSLLKMYFRELPNPLCTYQLYDNFVEAIQAKSETNERLRLMKETVLKLPPPHYRTLRYLSEHLNKISQHSERTGMTDKNLAIVWAPNLLRSPALESGGVAALRGVGVQAVVTEYLIKNCHHIFDVLEESATRLSYIATQGAQPIMTDLRMDSLTDCESLLVEQREHDQSLSSVERPKSLSAGGPKLISLEEAQERHMKLDGFDMKQSMPINMMASVNAGTNIGSYIEVGGGPSSLPDKYHTVLSVPRSWQKRKTHSWKSLFTRTQRPVSNGATQDMKSSISAHAQTSSGNASVSTLGRQKESAVTFADTDQIAVLNGKSVVKSSLLKRDDKHKSIELYETSHSYCGEGSKPIEVCVRSNSIDSLRTAGHSRSVSHDSYFDILQSPQRAQMTTCPSRELSELGLNFDREEPEMRIFSESESLVSSPRVGKENIPPSSGFTTRRVLRARPEEFSSQTNSVNPSPKKQPRLNLLLSPSSAANPNNWPQGNTGPDGVGSDCNSDNCLEHTGDESGSKRYKLEDQLSDIQYIDCGTPEHSISNPQTVYANAQIHGSAKSGVSKGCCSHVSEIMSEDAAKMNTNLHNNPARYSYPTVHLGTKRKDQDNNVLTGSGGSQAKERFSYPGSTLSNERRFCPKDSISKMLVEEIGRSKNQKVCNSSVNSRTVHLSGSRTTSNSTSSSPKTLKHHTAAKPGSYDLLKVKNRNSYCYSISDTLQQQLLRSCSAEIAEDNAGVFHNKILSNEMELSKISVTPSSPLQSPRYSLLLAGDTSSENSSAVQTPQHDLDPLMVSSVMSGISAASSNQVHQLLLGMDSASYLDSSHESLESNHSDKRDMQALRCELSLDLNPLSTKFHSTIPDLTVQRLQQNLNSPNNSNITDNTSQSVTPSEFGYQHLQRQLSIHSLLGTEDNSPTYEEYENTPSNMNSPMKLVSSPLKATINITYNMKSPTKEELKSNMKCSLSGKEKPYSRALLETSFDETTVYEQVKFFRNSVTEVNELLNEGSKYQVPELENLAEVEELSDSENEDKDNAVKIAEQKLLDFEEKHKENIEDINMLEGALARDKLLLYENIELRKPSRVYQNLLGEEMKHNNQQDQDETVKLLENEDDEEEEEVELDSLDSIKEREVPSTEISTAARRSPSNLSVKELATRFEHSPVESLPTLDFVSNSRSSIRRPLISQTTDKSAKLPQTSSNIIKSKLNKIPQITRSLDENAFVREFGMKTLQDFNIRCSQQLSDSSEINHRRKSFDFTKPKTLNPPKRLPGVPITEEAVYVKLAGKASSKIDLLKENNFNTLWSPNDSSLEHDYESAELKITPTTENRISLIQNNVAIATNEISPSAHISADLNNSNLTPVNTSLKVLSGVKLDRERIDRIKEERRQQLTQKYHTDSFKSKSKTDLHTYKNDDEKFSNDLSLRIKSKSRADMRTLQRDMDNLKEFGCNPPITAVSELTLNIPCRMRSISDEKNQNVCDNSTATDRSLAEVGNNGSGILKDGNRKEPEEYSARATVQKFERKSSDFANGIATTLMSGRERQKSIEPATLATNTSTGRSSSIANREKISPQFSIRDVTAMFESRSQNQ